MLIMHFSAHKSAPGLRCVLDMSLLQAKGDHVRTDNAMDVTFRDSCRCSRLPWLAPRILMQRNILLLPLIPPLRIQILQTHLSAMKIAAMTSRRKRKSRYPARQTLMPGNRLEMPAFWNNEHAVPLLVSCCPLADATPVPTNLLVRTRFAFTDLANRKLFRKLVLKQRRRRRRSKPGYNKKIDRVVLSRLAVEISGTDSAVVGEP